MMSHTIMLFNLGGWEIGALVVVAFLVFGTRLPEVMRSMGRGINEFKRGLREVEEDPEPPKALDQQGLDQKSLEKPRERTSEAD